MARARRETPPTGKSRKKGQPAPNRIPGAAPAGETPAGNAERGEQADRR
jgi:hypothetical protein